MDNLLYRVLASQHSWVRDHPNARVTDTQVLDADTPNEHIYIIVDRDEQAIYHTDARDNLIDVTILPTKHDG